jgi:hypothetical protein
MVSTSKFVFGLGTVASRLVKSTAKWGLLSWPFTRNLFDERTIEIDREKIKCDSRHSITHVLEVKHDNFLYFDRVSVLFNRGNSITTNTYNSFRKVKLLVDDKQVYRQTDDFVKRDYIGSDLSVD